MTAPQQNDSVRSKSNLLPAVEITYKEQIEPRMTEPEVELGEIRLNLEPQTAQSRN